jgi:FdhD protein
MSGNGTTSVAITRINGEQIISCDDILAIEEPLEVRLGFWSAGRKIYRSVSVTMRTPGHDSELAAGFLFTEGIIASAKQVQSSEPWGPLGSDGTYHNIIKVDLMAGVGVDLKRLERHFYTASSCGVCGKASLDAVRASACLARIDRDLRVSPALLHDLPRRLRERQDSFAVTGGLHAAALFSADGDIVCVREDIGRHNAVDKIIGAQLIAGGPLTGVLLVSGRAGFELAQKAVAAGIPVLAAVGAPSSLAVELAEEFDLTLVGFLRGGRFNIYSGAQRINL